LAATALTALNDAITREAFSRGADCIDLRVLCDDDRDFANPKRGPFSASPPRSRLLHRV
jgi:hypothetical protein